MDHTVVCEMWGHMTETTWPAVLSGSYIWHSRETLWAGPHSQGFDAAASSQPALGQMLHVPERFLWLSTVFESLAGCWRMTTAQTISLPATVTHCQMKCTDQLYSGFSASKHAYSLVRPFSQLSSNTEQENTFAPTPFEYHTAWKHSKVLTFAKAC